uniref:Uncharacterized protein n=1 Tax=Anguilla anguilla TaxID=7936 RepID=A0A0E9SY68_ANGAN
MSPIGTIMYSVNADLTLNVLLRSSPLLKETSTQAHVTAP